MRAFVYAVVISTLAVSAFTAGCNIGRSSPVYNQCDSRWGSNQLGSSSTICKVGCLMCSVASALSGLGKKVNGKIPTPDVVNSFIRNEYGYKSNPFIWTSVERCGIKYEGQLESTADIQKALCDKKVVILLVDGGGHWLLATGYDGNTFYVNDSSYNRGSYPARDVVLASIYKAD